MKNPFKNKPVVSQSPAPAPVKITVPKDLVATRGVKTPFAILIENLTSWEISVKINPACGCTTGTASVVIAPKQTMDVEMFYTPNARGTDSIFNKSIGFEVLVPGRNVWTDSARFSGKIV